MRLEKTTSDLPSGHERRDRSDGGSPDPVVAHWFSSLDAFSVSAVTLEELVYGLRRRNMLAKEAWLRRILADKADIVLVTVAAAHGSGEKRAVLESAGRPVTQTDSLIAACAGELGLVLATRNVDDFRGFGVPLFNPFE
jgi:predicted nucleic acid-binding protein